MSKIDRQVEGILIAHQELSEGIIDSIEELDGGDTSQYSDVEKQAIVMGFVMHFSEVMLALKSVTMAREAFITKNKHYSANDRLKSLVDSSYYAAVRKTKELGGGNLSIYDVSKAQAETIIDQFGWEPTKKNISLVAGHIVVTLNELNSLGNNTGGVKAGNGKKKFFIFAVIVIAAILLFTVGPFGNRSGTSDRSQEKSVETSADIEPVYKEVGDIKFQVNVNGHSFITVKDYTDLSFSNYTEGDEKDWSNEDKKAVWDKITYGEEYRSDEKVFQDNNTEDIVDFVIINIGEDSMVSNLDDYITWEKENFDSFDRSEDFSLDGVHACKLFSTNEDSESIEIIFIYDDKFYLIRPLGIYEDNSQLANDIIEGIELEDSDEYPDSISWKDAGDHVGETVTIKGEIAEVNYSSESNGKPIFIDLGKAYPAEGRVTATIWEEDQDNFGIEPEDFDSEYPVGDTIYVKGTVEVYEDAYSIKVSDPSQIMK